MMRFISWFIFIKIVLQAEKRFKKVVIKKKKFLQMIINKKRFKKIVIKKKRFLQMIINKKRFKKIIIKEKDFHR